MHVRGAGYSYSRRGADRGHSRSVSPCSASCDRSSTDLSDVETDGSLNTLDVSPKVLKNLQDKLEAIDLSVRGNDPRTSFFSESLTDSMSAIVNTAIIKDGKPYLPSKIEALTLIESKALDSLDNEDLKLEVKIVLDDIKAEEPDFALKIFKDHIVKSWNEGKVTQEFLDDLLKRFYVKAKKKDRSLLLSTLPKLGFRDVSSDLSKMYFNALDKLYKAASK